MAYDAGGNYVTSAGAAADGSYTLTGLRSGTYKVELVAPGHQAQWHDGRATMDAADPVSVTEGQATSGIDGALAAGGSIVLRRTAEDAAGNVRAVTKRVTVKPQR